MKTYLAPKRGLDFLARRAICCSDSMEEVNVGHRKRTFAALFSAIFRTPSFRKSWKFFGTSFAPLDSEIVELPAFSILSAMFTGACGPPEKLSLALMQRLNLLRMIVKLAYFNTGK